MCPWFAPSPHSGGTKIPPQEYSTIIKQADSYAASRPWNASYKLQLRFSGKFCYVDSIEKDEVICPLGRLRYFSPNRWSMAFFTYSDERYTPCSLPKEFGTLEEALRVCESYL